MNVVDELTREILATAEVFAIPMTERFRGTEVREGMLLRGPAGWGEFAPFADYDEAGCVPWLRAALAAATTPFPARVRTSVPVNAIVPAVSPRRAAELVAAGGCHTAKVKVAGPGSSLDAELDRVAAVRSALGPDAHIRVDANGGWDVEDAVTAIQALDAAAGGLQYVEQPCATVPELAAVRRRVDVPVAADESIRRAVDPLAVARAGAADIAVVKVAPLGGVLRTLAIAAQCGLPVVVSSAVDTAVGLAAGLAAAGALPELPYACGLGTASLLTTDVSSSAPTLLSGRLPVPTRPPEPDRLERVAAGPETVRAWQARLARVAGLLSSELSPGSFRGQMPSGGR